MMEDNKVVNEEIDIDERTMALLVVRMYGMLKVGFSNGIDSASLSLLDDVYEGAQEFVESHGEEYSGDDVMPFDIDQITTALGECIVNASIVSAITAEIESIENNSDVNLDSGPIFNK